MPTGPEISPEVLSLVQPGKKVRLFYGEGKPANEVRHIRAIVDENQVVYKVWSRSKQRWIYHIEWMYSFQMAWEGGHLKGAGD